MDNMAIIKILIDALKGYVKQHDEDIYELSIDANMENPPRECDCKLCKAARIAIEKAKG